MLIQLGDISVIILGLCYVTHKLISFGIKVYLEKIEKEENNGGHI